MYTIKTLSAINQNYCYSHKVTQVDVDNVNAMVEAIENVFGYRLFDKVQFDGQDCFIYGRRSTGIFTIKTITGKMIKDGISFKKLKLLEKSTNYLIA